MGRLPDVYALVDCADFFVACERVFDPALRNRPVVVLSNNDGCIVSRSREVKAAGVPMAAPYFRWKPTLDRIGARVCSSNYGLYAALSRRVMAVLAPFAAALEVYSVDEAFLTVPDLGPVALHALGGQLVERVGRHVGVPVRVGVGPTKTLAKAAVEAARHRSPPVVVGADDAALGALPVEEVWGIGRRLGPRLRALGVPTALALRDAPDRLLGSVLNVVGMRTVWELRGRPCFRLQTAPPPHKSLIRSRSFGHAVTRRSDLAEALAHHASRAAETLRAERLVAGALTAFVTTGPHTDTPYAASDTAALPAPTSDTAALVAATRRVLDRVYAPGVRYRKAGVMLFGLVPEDAATGHLFVPDDPARRRLMAALDALNRRYGPDTVRVAAAGTARPWAMRRDHLSAVSLDDPARFPVVLTRPPGRTAAGSAFRGGLG